MAFRILNGVFQAVREFVQTRQPDIVILTAKSEDLASIYATYLRRESGTLELLGYLPEGPIRIDPFSECTLRRV